MSTLRPTLSQIIERIQKDAETRLEVEELSRSDLQVYVRVLAGASHALYGAIEYAKKQLFLDSCETIYLERLASIFNLNRKLATKTTGQVTFVFSDSLVDVPIGTVLLNGDNQYITTTSVSALGVANVESVLAGTQYNLPINTELSLSSPIAGVDKARVTVALDTGTDEETDDELRARALQHTKYPPRQGTKTDYVEWAKEVEGVGYAWCYPKELGTGTVTVRILDDDYNDASESLIGKVKTYLESKMSVLAQVFVASPVAQNVNFTIKITPDNTSNRELVRSAIEQVFKSEAVPGGSIYLSHINQAISNISSEENHVIVSPTQDLVSTSNAYLLRLGDITWQS